VLFVRTSLILVDEACWRWFVSRGRKVLEGSLRWRLEQTHAEATYS